MITEVDIRNMYDKERIVIEDIESSLFHKDKDKERYLRYSLSFLKDCLTYSVMYAAKKRGGYDNLEFERYDKLSNIRYRKQRSFEIEFTFKKEKDIHIIFYLHVYPDYSWNENMLLKTRDDETFDISTLFTYISDQNIGEIYKENYEVLDNLENLNDMGGWSFCQSSTKEKSCLRLDQRSIKLGLSKVAVDPRYKNYKMLKFVYDFVMNLDFDSLK